MGRNSAAWKQLERDTAAALGGKRNRLYAYGADVDAPGVLAECKWRAKSAHGSLYRQERAKRRGDLAGRLFVLVTRDRGHEALATVRLAELAKLLKAAGDLDPPSGGWKAAAAGVVAPCGRLDQERENSHGRTD